MTPSLYGVLGATPEKFENVDCETRHLDCIQAFSATSSTPPPPHPLCIRSCLP